MNKIILILLLFVFPTFAEDSSILGYFADRSYWLNIPDGFYQDGQTASKIGAVFLLLPNGYNFNGAPAVMYSAVYANKTVKNAIEFDEAKFLNESEGLVVTEPKSLKTHDGKVVLVKEFINPSSMQQPFESVAYIQEGEAVVTIVVSAFKKENYDYILSEYHKMLGTYESSNVKVMHNK